MIISFELPKHEQLANDFDKLESWCRKKGTCHADDVLATLNSLEAADCLFDVPTIPFHPHPLTGKLKGHFAIWIDKKFRLILRPDHNAADSDYRIDNYKTIKKVVVVELCVDYHDN
jgi:plasmid maintenance system killer protein